METGQARRPAGEGTPGQGSAFPPQKCHGSRRYRHRNRVVRRSGDGDGIWEGDHNGSTEEQVEQIWRELDAVREDLGRLRTETTARAKAIEKSVEDLRQKNSEGHQDLLRRIEQAEKEQSEFNARALPLIGCGIVLTAAASWLAERPLWVNVVVIAAVLALSIRVVGPIVRRGWRRWQNKRRLAPAEPA